jgi:hypothetical protein
MEILEDLRIGNLRETDLQAAQRTMVWQLCIFKS